MSDGAKKYPSNRVVKKGLFAPASPARSRNISTSTGTRKPSLRALDTGSFVIVLLCISF
jgi:hypothetical protein